MAGRAARTNSTLETILDAAEDILKRRGSEGLSVRAVAQKVGISVGNLQYHLPTRAKLLDAAISRRADEFRTEILAELEPIVDPRRRFEALVDSWLAAQYRSDQVLFWHLWAISAHDTDARKTMDGVYSEMTDFVASLLREIDPNLTRQRSKRRAAVIMSTVEGSGLFVGHGRRPNRELSNLQIDVKNAVMVIAGCPKSTARKSSTHGRAGK
jgi:AcrR family transcriptional regulator